jgi:hypothetical protein
VLQMGIFSVQGLCNGIEFYFNTASIRCVSLALLRSLLLKLVDCCVEGTGTELVPADILLCCDHKQNPMN